MKQLEQQIKAINKSLQSQNELMQKRTDELEAMLKELKAKNAELSQNLASLQKDYHEIVKSLTSTQSKDNTAAQQSQPQQPAQPTQIPQPRVSRVKDILAGNISGNTTKESMQDKELQEFAYKGTSLDYGLLNGEPVFNLNYIGKLLDINNPRTSINTSDEDYCIKLDNSIVGLTYNRKLHNTGELFITEAGLYKLLMRSDKPEAEIFQKWVTKEVLPSIRKSGSYKINPAQQREVFNLIYETPCRDAILKVVRDSEVQHNAKAKGIKEYTITEKMKRGKVYTNCQVGIEWDRYIPPTKPISKLRKAR